LSGNHFFATKQLECSTITTAFHVFLQVLGKLVNQASWRNNGTPVFRVVEGLVESRSQWADVVNVTVVQIIGSLSAQLAQSTFPYNAMANRSEYDYVHQ
jgi:hypothetical protein